MSAATQTRSAGWPELAAAQPAPLRADQASRLGYLDNLKIGLVAGVILDHAAGLFAGGGYGYVEPGLSYAASAVLWIAFGFGTMFAMGTFFFMAGWLVPASLVRKGANFYLRDRLIRLGAPWLVSIVLISPVCWLAATAAQTGSLRQGLRAAETNLMNPDPGVAWFISVLLIFSAAFVVLRRWRPAHAPAHGELKIQHLLVASGLIAAATFPMRLLFLAGSNQVLGLHVWQWPQYLTLFLMGALAAERGWLDQISRRVWLVLVLMVGGAGLAMTGGLLASGTGIDFTPFRGGWHWQAITFAVSEGALSVSLTVILVVLFRHYLNRQGGLTRVVSRDAYLAFIIQSPILVAGVLLLRETPLPAELKFILLGIGAVFGSFAVAHALRAFALIRRVA